MSEPPPRLSTSKVGLCCSCPLRGPRGRGVVWYWARVAVTVYDSVRVCVRSAPCAWRCAIVAGLARAPLCSLARILPCVISSSVSSCSLSLFVFKLCLRCRPDRCCLLFVVAFPLVVPVRDVVLSPHLAIRMHRLRCDRWLAGRVPTRRACFRADHLVVSCIRGVAFGVAVLETPHSLRLPWFSALFFCQRALLPSAGLSVSRQLRFPCAAVCGRCA